jgi:hypothetical protein
MFQSDFVSAFDGFLLGASGNYRMGRACGLGAASFLSWRKTLMAGNTGTLLGIGAAAVAGYFIYENYFANALPGDAAYLESVPAGSGYAVPQTFTNLTAAATAGGPQVGTSATTQTSYVYYSPSQKTFYLSFTAPSTAQQSAGQTYLASLQAAQPQPSASGSNVVAANNPAPPATTTTEAPPTVTPPPTQTTYPTPGGGTSATPTTLAGLWAAMQAWAAQDSNFTGSGGNLTGSLDHWNYYVTEVWPTPPAGFSGNWPPNFNAAFPNTDTGATMVTATQYWAAMQPFLAGQGLSGLLAGLGDCGGCDGGGTGLLTMLLAGAAGAALLVVLAAQGGAAMKRNPSGGDPMVTVILLGAVGVAAYFWYESTQPQNVSTAVTNAALQAVNAATPLVSAPVQSNAALLASTPAPPTPVAPTGVSGYWDLTGQW